jgi:small multidrug resistance family-3 protein
VRWLARLAPRRWAAYGGVFVAGSLAWGMVADGYRPDRYDVIGALIFLAGVIVIMYAPRD